MQCPECGAEVNAGVRYCRECGEEIDLPDESPADESDAEGLAAKIPGMSPGSTVRNVAVGVVIAFVVLGVLGAAVPGADNTAADGTNDPGGEAAGADETPTPEPDPKAEIRQLARNGVEEGGFADGVREIQVMESPDGGYSVNVRYNLSNPGDADADEFNANHMAIEINKRLYQSDYEIMQTGVFAYVPLQNQYGEQSDGVLHKATIEQETADRINWENILPKNIPEVADGYTFRSDYY